MAFYSLDQFRKLKDLLTIAHKRWLKQARGIDIPASVKLSLSARLAASAPGAIAVGEETLIAFKTLIYTRDPVGGEVRPVRIGKRCFIGGGSTILPGVSIGDECIVGAGSVVFENVPDHCIVGGNPARILRRDVALRPYGVLPVAKENTHRLWIYG